MKAFSFRLMALTIALTLGPGTVAGACAGDGAPNRTSQHVVRDSDEIAAREDLPVLAELLLLGLALFGEPAGTASPCSGCAGHIDRMTGIDRKRMPRAPVIVRCSFAMAVLGIATLTAACGPVPSSAGAESGSAQKNAIPHNKADCFYSDFLGTDRVVAGRVLHWCGPEPKALF